jgi:hypothetical protein
MNNTDNCKLLEIQKLKLEIESIKIDIESKKVILQSKTEHIRHLFRELGSTSIHEKKVSISHLINELLN